MKLKNRGMTMKPFGKLIDTAKKSYSESEVLHHNELEANRLVSHMMISSAGLLAVSWVLMYLGLFPVNADYFTEVAVYSSIAMLVPAVIGHGVGYNRWWVKIMLIGAMILSYASIDMMFSHKVIMLMVLPVVVSVRYYSKRFTAIVTVVTALVFAVSTALSPIYGWIDMNVLSIPAGTAVVSTGKFISDGIRNYGLDVGQLVRNTMLYSYLPRLFIFSLISTTCMNNARRGREMVGEQAAISRKTSRIDSELSLARDIQASMLSTDFPVRDEFDLFALMQPAKEVAGDFYDFSMPDDDHLVILIADVSGKGVPAALFMATARTLLRNITQHQKDPGKALTEANKRLCEGNDNDFFITAWLGILDIKTGHMVYANAGHCPPALCHNGQFTYLKCAPGFIMGGLEDVTYKSAEMDLAMEDVLYLYTDGVDEAEDENHVLYGNDRLLKVLNDSAFMDMKMLCLTVKDSVEYYARNVEQFDDITMLSLRYRGVMKDDNTITVEAESSKLENIMQFVNEKLSKAGCSPKVRAQLNVVVDELFSNIAKHAYPGKEGEASVSVRTDEENGTVSLTFTDQGIPFDPTEYVNPELEKPAEQRSIGGLGLFIVSKTVDRMKYRRENGQNILTVVKKLFE